MGSTQNCVLDACILVDLAEVAGKLSSPSEVTRQSNSVALIRGLLNRELTDRFGQTVVYKPIVSAHTMTAAKLTVMAKHGVEAGEAAMRAVEVLLSSGFFQFDDVRRDKAALREAAGRRSFVKGQGHVFAGHDWEDEAVIQMASHLSGDTVVITADCELRFVIDQTAKNLRAFSVDGFIAEHRTPVLVAA